MKYTSEIIVKLPLKAFIKKLNNYNNLKYWQYGLTSFEHLSGIPGKIGSRMQLNYTFGKRKLSLIETIAHTDFPKEVTINYDTKDLLNMQENSFKETEEGYTKWVSNTEFTAISLKMKLLTFFMPNVFKRQSLKYLTAFKNFAENGTSVQDA